MGRQLALFEYEKDLSSKSLIKYVGGKYYWRDDIIKFIPSGVNECVSPFMGGGHVEMLLSSKGFTMHCGDIYKPLVYCWNILLHQPEMIAERMDNLWVDRGNFAEIRRKFFELEDADEDWREIGTMFYMAIKVSYNGILGTRTPTGSIQGQGPTDRMRPKIIAENIRRFHAPRMTVDLCDYKELLSRHPGVFSYMDPPYRIEFNLYGGDGETHEGFDHDEYADFVLSTDNPFLISYNDDEWIRNRYRDCRIVTLHGRYSVHGKSRKVTEVLITRGLPDSLVDEVERNLKVAEVGRDWQVPSLFEEETCEEDLADGA